MNLFQAIMSRRKTGKIDSDHLPEVNAFVDVAAGGKTEHLPIEAVARKDFVVRRPAKAVVGEEALFNYSNRVGRFRFFARCAAIDGCTATYALPAQITVIDEFGGKRRKMRIKTTLAVRWRYAPDGCGYGNFTDGNAADLGPAGMALAVPRELRAGTQLEIQFDFGSGGEPFTVIGTLTRASHRVTSERFIAGMDFKSIRPTEENRIAEFIANRQKGQRMRALAD